jgi:hypothetical protein
MDEIPTLLWHQAEKSYGVIGAMLRLRFRSGAATSNEGDDAKGGLLPPPFGVPLSLTTSDRQDSTPGALAQIGLAWTPDAAPPVPGSGSWRDTTCTNSHAPGGVGDCACSQIAASPTACSHHHQLRCRGDSLCCCRFNPVARFHAWRLGPSKPMQPLTRKGTTAPATASGGSSEARKGCGEHSQGDGDRTSRTMTQFGNHAGSA